MLKSRKAQVLAVVLTAALIVCISVAVLSQQVPQNPQFPPMNGGGNQPPPGMPPPGQGQMGPGMQGGYGGGRMPMMGMGMGSGTAAIAATSEYVYVVQGNTLYQFSAKTLKQTNKAELSSTRAGNVYTPNQAPPQ